MARVFFTVGLDGLHLARALCTCGSVALHLAWFSFNLARALFIFGVVALHLIVANVLFTFGLGGLHLARAFLCSVWLPYM